jgi:hypothetical protein
MFGKILRVIGIVLMGLTAVVTLMGGIGTSCVAIDAGRYDSMAGLADFQWLYVLYVLIGIVLGILGIRATWLLIKSRDGAYRQALIILILGLAIGGLHMFTSRSLRGSSMPVDFIVYITAITLAAFLLFRIPGIWKQINLSGREDDVTGLGAGVTMIVAGVMILTVQFWAGPTHTLNGINYADVWHVQLAIAGWGALLAGSIILLRNILGYSPRLSSLNRREPARKTAL